MDVEPNPAPPATGARGRSDAARNTEAVLLSARAVFADRGASATIPEIAQRAGVGNATVYRAFGSKSGLLAAVGQDLLSWVSQRIAEAMADATQHGAAAWPAFLEDLFERLRTDRMTLSLLCGELIPGLGSAEAEVRAAMGALVSRMQDVGALRPDVNVEDVTILVTGCATGLDHARQQDPAQWRRFADHVQRALAPSTPSRGTTPAPSG